MNSKNVIGKLKMFEIDQINDYGFFCDIEEPYNNIDKTRKMFVKNNIIYENKIYYNICEQNNKKSDSNLKNLTNSVDDDIKEVRKKLALVVGIFCVSLYIIIIVV